MKARINLRRKSVGTPMAATQAAVPSLGPNGGYDPSAGSRTIALSRDDQERISQASAQAALVRNGHSGANEGTPPIRSTAKRRRESVTKCKTLLGGPPSAKAAKHTPDTSDEGHSNHDQLSMSLLFDNPEDGGRRLSVGRGSSTIGHNHTDKLPGKEAEREDKEMMMMDWKSKFTPGEIVIYHEVRIDCIMVR
ncbi:hypothetical protein Pmar_PMAR021198 [Perkinsus marinus ATCC 50983]|uniref:Uncharacterized protein n=1 Tax=Perkinsus marinus (strain ATCC 50983 / TXsc) TaxID=423536 RepID=C5KM25_PERM5|nr:hypothetical protein Pmar_PMAR021198 [Perkinsus marinus ATCC 50983]EER14444.1 hypothetical protein Pmar_PMAR021198 [Perkinsus marinus ATCC 50983]|eukprot:XP_002782649.1 hypothetical protein Pmar_PMAR021198 [Perkinsus marinus ATCC 50983]